MAIDFAKMKKSHQDQGIQRTKLTVDDMGSYTGNQSLFMTYPMRELLITNDDPTASLTLVVSNSASDYTVTFVLKAGEVLDERFYPFDTVAVTATGAWRYIVRSGVIT